MEDWERELLILKLQEDADSYDSKRERDLAKNPPWWNIRLGLVESTEKQYQEAGKIMKEFIQLKALEGETVQQRFLRFTQIKLTKGGV